MRLPSARGRESNVLTAISSQVEIRPRRLACWSPLGREEEESGIVPLDPLPDGERRSLVREQVHGADVGGEHGAHRERGLRVGGIDDGLRHGAFHGLGERAELGLEQVVHQHPVAGLAALPEHGGTV